MILIKEDNNGFINFPNDVKIFDILQSKTLVYLVAFDSSDLNGKYILSNINITSPSNYLIDDVTQEPIIVVEGEKEVGGYFRNADLISIPLTSCICIGWSNNTFISKEGKSWFASFRDLTSEGRKLYYSMKKLHNNKEVRILTFNKI